jgi:hypothetical protein
MPVIAVVASRRRKRFVFMAEIYPDSPIGVEKLTKRLLLT